MSWVHARLFFQIWIIFSLFPGLLSLPAFATVAVETSKLADVPLETPRLVQESTSFKLPTEVGVDLPEKGSLPKKVTCLTIGSRGDVQPYIALCQRLLILGHSCAIATHEKFRSFVQEHGIEFRMIAGDPKELLKFSTDYGVFSLSFWRLGYKNFKPWFDQLLETSMDACKGSDILIENPSAMVGVHIAQSLNIPYFRSFSMPWTKTGAYPHSLFAKFGNWGRWYNKMTYMAFDRMVWTCLGRTINNWRTTSLGLKPTTLSELSLSKVPFLYYFSPSLLPKAKDWNEAKKVTGFWFMNPDKNYRPPEDLIKKIDAAIAQHKKIVYIGFGSITVPNPEKMTQAIIDAVDESKVFAVVSGGWTAEETKAADTAETEIFSMKNEINKRPDNMFYVDSVSHDWLFPQISAALHHGGAGTTAASLRAGIPTLIKPFFGDQFVWAPKVEELGVGTHLKSLSKEDIRDAILKATTSDEQKIKASELGKKIREEDGVSEATDIIFDNLDYAHDLIQKMRKPILKTKTQTRWRDKSPLKVISTYLNSWLPLHMATQKS